MYGELDSSKSKYSGLLGKYLKEDFSKNQLANEVKTYLPKMHNGVDKDLKLNKDKIAKIIALIFALITAEKAQAMLK